MSPGHYYTIIPHEMVTEERRMRFNTETGELLKTNEQVVRRYRCFRYYLNKNSKPINLNTTWMKNGSKNLIVCFNSRFEPSSDDVACHSSDSIKFVEIESEWREFKEHGLMNFYEVKGVRFGLSQIKDQRYEFSETKKEHKKIILKVYSEYSYQYRYYVELGFYWSKCDYFYEEDTGNRCYYRGRAKERYSQAEQYLKELNERVFVAAFGIGAELRKKFNKNLPALYEKKEIVEYLKH